MTAPTASTAATYGRLLAVGSAGAGPGIHAIDSARVEDVVSALLSDIGGDLPESARGRAPILLVAGGLVERRAEAFVAQCRKSDLTGRRMRPLASVRMEPAVILRWFARRTGWSGAAYAIVTPGPDAAASALRWAAASVSAARAPGAYVCEVTPWGPDGDELLAVGLVVGAARERPVPEPAPWWCAERPPYLPSILRPREGVR